MDHTKSQCQRSPAESLKPWILWLLFSLVCRGRVAIAAPDTLVVCPAMLQPALTEWKAFRQQQGHEILVVAPPLRATELRSTIRDIHNQANLKYVILVGDAPSLSRGDSATYSSTTIPTNYVSAKINSRWGSPATIASDIPYADIDGDDLPDLAIGRIPAATVQQVATVLQKSLDYERNTSHGNWERQLKITSGDGGFGVVADAIIAAAARQVITQTVPADYVTEHICPQSFAAENPETAISFSTRAREQFNAGSLAWIYLGHGLPTELDHVRTRTGHESILSVRDVSKLKCRGHNPLAVLIACYTGAIDAPYHCLAEELLLAEEGPVAVIAATRVTMPYGNTVLGCELLRACFRDRPQHLGDTIRIAERKTLTVSNDDSLRTSLDSIAAGVSPAPVDLAGERREHVLMYHLLGDPLLHLRYAVPVTPPSSEGPAANP